MSRKDYVAVAAEIKNKIVSYTQGSNGLNNLDFYRGALASLKEAAHGLADVFAASNPRFDRQRFLTACGVN